MENVMTFQAQGAVLETDAAGYRQGETGVDA